MVQTHTAIYDIHGLCARFLSNEGLFASLSRKDEKTQKKLFKNSVKTHLKLKKNSFETHKS